MSKFLLVYLRSTIKWDGIKALRLRHFGKLKFTPQASCGRRNPQNEPHSTSWIAVACGLRQLPSNYWKQNEVIWKNVKLSGSVFDPWITRRCELVEEMCRKNVHFGYCCSGISASAIREPQCTRWTQTTSWIAATRGLRQLQKAMMRRN